MARSVATRGALKLALPVIAIGLVAALATPPATASPAAEPESESAILMNYAVNSDTGAAAMDDVAEAVEAAGGEVLSQYPEVGVTIAQSDGGKFASTLRKVGIIDSVGATRTSAVGSTLAPKRGFEQDQRLLLDPEPREGEQWGNTKLQSLAANEIEDGKKSVLVGVLDSGVNDLHEDLGANFNKAASADCVSSEGAGPVTTDGAWRPTSSAHGTHVAGTVQAARNGKGIAGIAPGVEYASIKVVNDSGYIFPEYAICGFMWAAEKGVDITNNSYYIDPWMFWCKNDKDQGAVQEAVKRVIKYTHDQGVVNVAAAGNSSIDLANKTTDSSSPNDSTPIIDRPINQNCLDMPAEIKGVITVSSIQSSGTKSSFSNYGLGVIDVAAPGSAILSSVWPGESAYASFSGTSMASPHVAGVIALMESKKAGLSLKKITKKLYKQSVDTACGGAAGCEGTPANNGFYGRGVVNALNAVK